MWIRLKESRKIFYVSFGRRKYPEVMFQMHRKGSFETKTLESREKICSENEKKGISGSHMFQLHRKGVDSFESEISSCSENGKTGISESCRFQMHRKDIENSSSCSEDGKKKIFENQ